MNSIEIKYLIDNQDEIYEELEKISENLPLETSEKLEELLENGDVEEAFLIIKNSNLDSNITLSSLKLLKFLDDTELKDKLFSNDEYVDILKKLVDMYGEKLSEIMNTNSKSFKMKEIEPLLFLDNPKYVEVYKSILEKKLASAYLVEDVIKTLENSNSNAISEELIINFLEKYNSSLMGKDARELLKTLPLTILQDGNIVKMMVEKIHELYMGDEEILNYIPATAYDTQFVKELLDKSKYIFSKVFEHIPLKLRTREIWEKACANYAGYLNLLPNDNIDFNLTYEEYVSWMEDLILKTLMAKPENAISIFANLDDQKKTARLCQKIAESILNKNKAGKFLESVPESSKTLQLYETLVSKAPEILKSIPLKVNLSNISQEEYDKWLENLISQTIMNVDDIVMLLYHSIPKEKINERIWNELLDKCIALNVDKKQVSLNIVDFENLTPQMVERAMKDIDDTQIYYVPCIDKDLNNLDDYVKKMYEKWQNSLTEEQKQIYRNWYEQIWIKFVNKTQAYGSVYSYVPKQAITVAMNKACIDANYKAIEKMPIPENSQQLQEYQQLLIYALGKMPSIDYTNEQITTMYGDIDILENISKEYINEEVLKKALEKNVIYLTYANPTLENFRKLVDIAFKNKLKSMGRTELTDKEFELMQRFALNNSELFKTLQLEILDPKIINAIGEASLEKITRYKDVQDTILGITKDEAALKTFGFALETLKKDNVFIEPLIEKLSNSISKLLVGKYSTNAGGYVYESTFLNLVSQRIDANMPFTEYEKAIISYLAFNPYEGRKITSYDEVLTFVERKNIELENVINNPGSTLIEIKNAYLERIVGLNYEEVANLVTMYGNDSEQLLQKYININPKSFKELSEKEALEIIIKLKSFMETQDIDVIKNEFYKIINQEKKENSFLRYQKLTVLETSLRRAYGRDVVNSLDKNGSSLQIQELEFEGEKYFVRTIDGNFNRMVSLLGAYRSSTEVSGDMYDRWNTSQMANNHALCYSLINQSNPGTAMINGKTGVIISIDGFTPEALSAAAPYDLCSDNRKNTLFTGRQQRFFSIQNMPNQTRGMYSEYDIEIQDILAKNNKYQKIQPATIICFEKVDEDSIRAAIELGKKLGHPVFIELIDRRKLAQTEMDYINKAFNNFKDSKDIDCTLVEEIITRFNNVRNAHRFSDLADELLGENELNENKDAPFNIRHLNEMLEECLSSVEQKIRNGQVDDGLKALENIKKIIYNERQKAFLMPTMYEKQLWTGIDMNIDYILDELQRTYGKQIIKPLEKSETLETLSQMKNQDLTSVTFDVTLEKLDNLPEQLTAKQVMQTIDEIKLQESIAEIHSLGFYQGHKLYDEEHIARVILYSNAISKMEGFDDRFRKLLTEVAKYYACGRQLDIVENDGFYSAKLAGKALKEKYSVNDLAMIQATIELQNFKPKSDLRLEIEEEKREKLIQLCDKYGINEKQAIVVKEMSSCISDSVKLEQTRFVDKANNKVLNNSFELNSLELESAKKMIKFSYSLQEQLAKKELDKLAMVAQVDFDKEKDHIMQEFFTEASIARERRTKDEAITNSPIVRLEYLKTKYPEIVKMDLDAFLNEQAKTMGKKSKLQLEEQKRNLRRQQFEALVTELGIGVNLPLTLDKLLEQQKIIQQQALKQNTELDMPQGMMKQ